MDCFGGFCCVGSQVSGVWILEGDLEDSGGFFRKVWISVESSIGPVLLKAHDPYSNRGESWRI